MDIGDKKGYLTVLEFSHKGAHGNYWKTKVRKRLYTPNTYRKRIRN